MSEPLRTLGIWAIALALFALALSVVTFPKRFHEARLDTCVSALVKRNPQQADEVVDLRVLCLKLP